MLPANLPGDESETVERKKAIGKCFTLDVTGDTRKTMAKRMYEMPRKGNPYQLPVRQHVFPARSIARFNNAGGVVQLVSLARKQTREAKASDGEFCAVRAWDRQAEQGYMKQIEDEFQILVEEVLAGKISELREPLKGVIDRFFALWKWRASYRDKEIKAIPFVGVTGQKLSLDQEELLEKKGILFLREDASMPAHRMNGVEIHIAIDYESDALSDICWNVLRTRTRELIVPDAPTAPIVPLTPSLCLCGCDQYLPPNSCFDENTAAEINQLMVKGARSYYFARDLSRCST